MMAGLQRPMLDGQEISQGLTTPVRVDRNMRSRLSQIARAVCDCGAVFVLAAVGTASSIFLPTRRCTSG